MSSWSLISVWEPFCLHSAKAVHFTIRCSHALWWLIALYCVTLLVHPSRQKAHFNSTDGGSTPWAKYDFFGRHKEGQWPTSSRNFYRHWLWNLCLHLLHCTGSTNSCWQIEHSKSGLTFLASVTNSIDKATAISFLSIKIWFEMIHFFLLFLASSRASKCLSNTKICLGGS